MLDGSESDSSDDEPTRERYMCQVSLEPLQSKTVVDGVFRVCRTNGEPVRVDAPVFHARVAHCTCVYADSRVPACPARTLQISSASGEPVYISVSVFLSAEAVASTKTPLPPRYKVGDTLGNRVVAVTLDGEG